MLELALPETPGWVAQFERPDEVAGLLEIWPNRVYLVYQILHAYNAILAQVVLNDGVVTQR